MENERIEKWHKFFGKGWTDVLIDFLDSAEFKAIGDYIAKERRDGKIVSPALIDIFRAFKECTWSNLNTVIMGIEPYITKVDNQRFTADGLAFSARHATKMPSDLIRLYEAIDNEIYQGDGLHLGVTTDLDFLANQGVLLLNASLTSVIGQSIGHHTFIWNRFMEVLLRKINEKKDSVGFILMGDKPASYKNLLTNESFHVQTCEHPMEAKYRGSRRWDSNGAFKALDAWHRSFNNIKIRWCEDEDSEGTEQQFVYGAEDGPYEHTSGIF